MNLNQANSEALIGVTQDMHDKISSLNGCLKIWIKNADPLMPYWIVDLHEEVAGWLEQFERESLPLQT